MQLWELQSGPVRNVVGVETAHHEGLGQTDAGVSNVVLQADHLPPGLGFVLEEVAGSDRKDFPVDSNFLSGHCSQGQEDGCWVTVNG